MEISADYTDYADYVRSSDAVLEDQNAYLANRSSFTVPSCTAPNRNLRNLCNLRIFNFCCPQSAVPALCLNSLRLR
jgi:hypothetical protein